MSHIKYNILLVINAEKCLLIENPSGEKCTVLLKLRGRQWIRKDTKTEGGRNSKGERRVNVRAVRELPKEKKMICMKV